MHLITITVPKVIYIVIVEHDYSNGISFCHEQATPNACTLCTKQYNSIQKKKAKRYKDSCPMNSSLMVCIKSDLLFIFRLILSLSLSIETNTFVQCIEMLIICWCWNSFVHILNFWCLAWLTRTHFISFKIKIYWCQSPETVVSPFILIIQTIFIDLNWLQWILIVNGDVRCHANAVKYINHCAIHWLGM